MNAKPKPEEIGAAEPLTGLALLRAPFPPNQVSKLPKETRAQIDARKGSDGRKVTVFNCAVCGGHHHKDAVHLDYVGHAALTDRLLDADEAWSWEPMACGPDGLPAIDRNGALWIKLTVCGVTRLGYGNAEGKSGGDAMKEIIGDALRNAAMRFGAALDLWHKGDLHGPEEEGATAQAGPDAEQAAINLLRGAAGDADLFKEAWANNKGPWSDLLGREAYGRVVAEMKRLGALIAEHQRRDAEADAVTFRGGGESRVAGNGRDDQGHEFPGVDEIPW